MAKHAAGEYADAYAALRSAAALKAATIECCRLLPITAMFSNVRHEPAAGNDAFDVTMTLES
jgi:hypothetical protein